MNMLFQKKRTNELDNKIITLYSQMKSIKKVSKKLSYSTTLVTSALIDNGIKLNPYGRNNLNKYFLNRNFFETIDTEEKAYWLGFITADGYVNHTGLLGIGLNQKDYKHLEKFLVSINSNYKVRFRDVGKYKKSEIYLFSKKLITDLQKLGIYRAKSLNSKPCTQVPENLLRHYWRGLVDGDGCIYINRNEKNSLKCVVSLCGTYEICKGFKDFIIKNKIISKANILNCKSIHTISFGGARLTQKIITILYKDAQVYLNRKKILAEEILRYKFQRGERVISCQ